MNDDQSIILHDFGGVPEIPESSHTRKLQLIESAQAIAKVTNDQEQSLAIIAERDLANLRKGVENARKLIKAPVIELGKKIDQIAADFMADAEREEKRLQGLVNHWQKKLLEDRREAERKADIERQKIAREAEAARRLQEDADRKRQAAELAKSAAAKAKAIAEANQLEEQAMEAALQAETAAMSSAVTVAPIEQPKGLTAKEFVDYEVIGSNEFTQHQSLIRFAAAYPNLVKIEIRRRDLLEALNDGRITEAPGIKIRKDLKTSVR